MRRVDLRKSEDFFADLKQILKGANLGEILVVLFEIKDFSPVEESFKKGKDLGYELLNSLKFNQVDWTIVIKKVAHEL